MTATYWEIGRRIVEFEQGGTERAAYGEALVERLSEDLTGRFGRGFSRQNLGQMRAFYRAWPAERICQTVSGKSLPTDIFRLQSPELRAGSTVQPPHEVVELAALANVFPLPWSAYVRLLSVKNQAARRFYETEALRCGWSVRQLDRQVSSQFYERTALSKNKAAMLENAVTPEPTDVIKPEEAIRDPFVLEFLSLKDEYSESDLEDALIGHLADFLLELGDDFAFVGRTGLTLNGSAQSVDGHIRLTGRHVYQAGSVFTTQRVNVLRFDTSFRFRLNQADACLRCFRQQVQTGFCRAGVFNLSRPHQQ